MPWHLQAKRPQDTSSRHLWLVNKGERTITSPLALGYPLLGPSRHFRAYHCMPSSLGFLCSDSCCIEIFRPLFRRSAPFPLVLGCSRRPLVGVAAENSEVVQETPHPLFFLPPPQPAPPVNSLNITHSGSFVPYPSCSPQIPQTRSASCVKSPRCSHLPS